MTARRHPVPGKGIATEKVIAPHVRPDPPTSIAPTPGPKTRGVDRSPADRRPISAKETATDVRPARLTLTATTPAPKILAAARKPAARRRTASAASQAVPK